MTTEQDDLIRTKDDAWLGERIAEFAAHADTYSVPADKVRMLFAKPRGAGDPVVVFEIIVIDQHGKLYPVGTTMQGDRSWKSDGMSRFDAVSRRFSQPELQQLLAERQGGGTGVGAPLA